MADNLPELRPFAFSTLSKEYQNFVVRALCDASIQVDERRLFAILSCVTDLDSSIKVIGKAAKAALKKHYHVDDVSKTADLNGDTCLHFAARAGHATVLRFLYHCELLRDIDSYVNREGDTPLHDAVSKRRCMFVKQLLALGANSRARNRHGKTPLSMARSMGDRELIEALMRPLVVEGG